MMHEKFAIVALAATLSGVGLALDNTLHDDYWDTRAYVNVLPTSCTSGTLPTAVSTPSVVVSVASAVQDGVFDSRWFSNDVSELLGPFQAYGPGFLLMFR